MDDNAPYEENNPIITSFGLFAPNLNSPVSTPCPFPIAHELYEDDYSCPWVECARGMGIAI